MGRVVASAEGARARLRARGGARQLLAPNHTLLMLGAAHFVPASQVSWSVSAYFKDKRAAI